MSRRSWGTFPSSAPSSAARPRDHAPQARVLSEADFQAAGRGAAASGLAKEDPSRARTRSSAGAVTPSPMPGRRARWARTSTRRCREPTRTSSWSRSWIRVPRSPRASRTAMPANYGEMFTDPSRRARRVSARSDRRRGAEWPSTPRSPRGRAPPAQGPPARRASPPDRPAGWLGCSVRTARLGLATLLVIGPARRWATSRCGNSRSSSSRGR